MPNTPTPDPNAPLAQRIEDHRQELLVLMADTERRDDITSGDIGPETTP